MDNGIKRHPVYKEEPIDIIAPDWVANSTFYVPRLKPEYREDPKTPWTPSKAAIAEIRYRKSIMTEAKEAQQGKEC